MGSSNVQKMRDALEMMISLFDKGVMCTSYANTPEEMEQIEELYRKAKSALSIPLRNCDVGTAEEQTERFKLFCWKRECVTCELSKRSAFRYGCFSAWAQMPYEEGDKK